MMVETPRQGLPSSSLRHTQSRSPLYSVAVRLAILSSHPKPSSYPYEEQRGR